MSKFGGNAILAGLGSLIIGKVDVIMISSEINLTNTGVYAIALFIATMIEIPSRSISSLVVPQVSAELNSGNMRKVAELYKKVTQNQLLISGTLLLLIWINIDNFFAIMPNGNLYNAGKYVVLFIGLGKFVDLTTGINSAIISYSRYYFLTPFCTILLGALAIVSNLILIPRFGITGAAIASLASLFIYNSIMVVLVQVLLKIQPFTWKCLQIVAMLAIAFCISLLLPRIGNPYISFAVQIAVIGIFAIFASVKFKLSEEAVEVTKMVAGRVRSVVCKK
jgi:O-antigen/teichoic acid export membrane protein